MVSYNTCELLRRCLQSTNEVTLPVDVVVVDNASSDGSQQMVRYEFRNVRLIANPENRGFAAATNQGIEAVRDQANFVLLLNPDAWLHLGAAEELTRFLIAHPRVGVAGARLLYPDGRPQEAAWRFPTLLMAFFDSFPPHGPLLGRLQGSFLNGRYQEERQDAPFPIDHPLGAAMLIRRETLAQVGLFDEAYWMYAEEVDWCRSCREAGWAIWQVPSARVVHVGGASSSQFRGRSFVALHRSRLRFVQKWSDARYARWYRRIIKLGMVWATLKVWKLWFSGRGAPGDLRAQLLAYGTVVRLTDQSSASESRMV